MKYNTRVHVPHKNDKIIFCYTQHGFIFYVIKFLLNVLCKEKEKIFNYTACHSPGID